MYYSLMILLILLFEILGLVVILESTLHLADTYFSSITKPKLAQFFVTLLKLPLKCWQGDTCNSV